MIITVEHGGTRESIELGHDETWALAEIVARARLDQLAEISQTPYSALDALDMLHAALRAVGIDVR